MYVLNQTELVFILVWSTFLSVLPTGLLKVEMKHNQTIHNKYKFLKMEHRRILFVVHFCFFHRIFLCLVTKSAFEIMIIQNYEKRREEMMNKRIFFGLAETTFLL